MSPVAGQAPLRAAAAHRCWGDGHALMAAYHDTEWGVPLYEDRKLFEFLVLDAMQAGLSWRIVLEKREGFRRALDGFDPARIARYRPAKIAALLRDPGIIRNRLKLQASVTNAQAFLELQRETGSFARWVWGLAGGRPEHHRFRTLNELPAKTPAAELISRELVRRGFRFVGPTITYAFMQAAGLVNDHLTRCFRHRQVRQLARPGRVV